MSEYYFCIKTISISKKYFKQGELYSNILLIIRSPLQRTFSMRASKNGSSKRPIATIGNKTSNIEEENEKDRTVDKENNDFQRASARKAKSARNPKKDSNIETEEALENGLHTLPAKDEVDVIDGTNNTRAENDNKGGENIFKV